MLTWNVTYHCKSGQREAFYQALCDLCIRANSLKEQAHCQTEIFGRLQELKAQYCDSVQIDKFND